MQRRMLRLDHIEILVLDEADRKLDMGLCRMCARSSNAVRAIARRCCFQATIPPELEQLWSRWGVAQSGNDRNRPRGGLAERAVTHAL